MNVGWRYRRAANRRRILVAVRSTGYEARPLACEFDRHERCPHQRGIEINFFRRGDHARAVWLCRCACHDTCPLADNERVTERAWSEGCTCPGAPAVREIEARVRETSEREDAARREALRAVVGRTTTETEPEQVRADLAAELGSRGVSMPDTAVDWTSRFIVASVRKDNLAALRLGVEGLHHAARFVRRIVREARSCED